MFIKAKVNAVITNLLIDTGATVTLISTGFIKDMSNMPTLSPSQRDILTANGESLKVAGKTIIEIQSDNFKCLNEAVVADINVDGILGLDFLKSQHAEIDMCNNTIKIQGHKIQFNIQGQIGCYRVTVSETVVIPPQSEIVVNGKVNDRFPILFKVGLVEPTEDFRKSDKALVGRTLVKTNKDIPLRLMNVSSQPKTLYEGTVIAKISPVSEIASPVSGKIHSKTEFPPYLKDLFEQSVKDLPPEQGSKVKHLLQTFSHIFAKDDADFGRTSIIKHEIEVQNAMPVKEPPRRVPYHLQGEYDTAIQDMLNKNVIEPSTSRGHQG